MEISPRRPEGILDMMGPRTLEGGYSPSQDISSAMAKEVVDMGVSKGLDALGAKATGVEVVFKVETGAKAEAMAATMAKMRMLSLAILEFIVWRFFGDDSCLVVSENGRQRRVPKDV